MKDLLFILIMSLLFVFAGWKMCEERYEGWAQKVKVKGQDGFYVRMQDEYHLVSPKE